MMLQMQLLMTFRAALLTSVRLEYHLEEGVVHKLEYSYRADVCTAQGTPMFSLGILGLGFVLTCKVSKIQNCAP